MAIIYCIRKYDGAKHLEIYKGIGILTENTTDVLYR